MKSILLITPSLLFSLLFSVNRVEAKSTVTLQNTINGESSDVHVESNGNESSSINVSQSNGYTKVELNKDGEVKKFESNGDNNTNWDSEDGSAHVKINNSGSARIMNDDTASSGSSTTLKVHNKDKNDNDKNDNDDEGHDNDSKSHNKLESDKSETANLKNLLSSLVNNIENFFTSLFK